MAAANIEGLLQAVWRRQRLLLWGRRSYWMLVGATALYALALLTARLTSLIPDIFTPWTLLAVPALAFLGAALFLPRTDRLGAAHLLDQTLQSKDLFLTAAAIENAPGQYRELVLSSATEKARQVQPSRIVPLRLGRLAVHGGLMLACLAAGVFWVPRLDPFGREQKRRQQAAQAQRLQELQRATQARIALLQEQPQTQPSAQAKAAIESLLQTFQQMKPADKAGNLAQLSDQQKQLGQLWRKLGAEQLRSAPPTTGGLQNFGLGDPNKLAQWKADLQKGKTTSLNQELNSLRQIAERLQDINDPVERERLRQELMDRLQALAEGLNQQAQNPAVNAALQRALEQAQMAGQPNLATEALQSLMESLNLTQQEIAQLAQSIQDMQSLEQALQALQQAKRLNDNGQLGGQGVSGLRSLEEYAAAFAAALAGQGGQGQGEPGEQPGQGLGGGIGSGSRPAGDDGLTTSFKPEQASSPFQPGQILMQWKTRGLSDPGEAQRRYQQAVTAARQQASEAIVSEQIPPAYHQTIQKYFDTLHESPTQTPPAGQ